MRYALLCLSFIVLGCSPEEAADPTEQPVDTDTPPTTSTTTTTATTTTATTTPPADLIDNTYVIDISSGTWIQPAGVGFIIGSLLEQELLLGITDVQGPDLYIIGALSDGVSGQDLCTTTFTTPTPADFSADPYFELITNEIVLSVSGADLIIADVAISGTFSADLSQMQDMSFAGIVDTSSLDTEPGETCDLLGLFGVSCDPCPAPSTNNTCLAIEVVDLTGQGVSGPLQTVTEADIAADPNCL